MVHRQTAPRGGRKGKRTRFDALLLAAEEQETTRDEDGMTRGYDARPKTSLKASQPSHVEESRLTRLAPAAANQDNKGSKDRVRAQGNVPRGKTPEEIKHMQKVVAAEKNLGACHPDVGRAILELGMYYNALGDMVHAQRCFQRSSQILSQHGSGSKPMEDESPVPVQAILRAQDGNQAYPVAVPKEEIDASNLPSSPCCVELSSSDLVHSVSQLVI